MKTLRIGLANLAGTVLSRKELKNLTGGDIVYSCWRAKGDFFESGNILEGPNSAAAWQNVWDGFGYTTGCHAIERIQKRDDYYFT